MKETYKLSLLFIFWSWAMLGQQQSVDSIAYSVNLEEYIVTAQYEPTHYKNAIHRVEIIDKKLFEHRGAVNLEQALTASSSVRLSIDPILGTSVRMRGISSSNVAILIDGVPVIGRLGGAIDLSQISLLNVERIEIIEGALSNIYGNNAAGGVINLITKKNQQGNLNFSIDSQVESIGLKNHESSLGFKAGKFLFNLNGRFMEYNEFPTDSMRQVDETVLSDGTKYIEERYPFNPKMQLGYGSFIRYNFDEESHAILKYGKNQEEVKDFGIIKRPRFNPYSNDRFYKTTRSDLSLSIKKKWSSRLFLDFICAFNDFNRIVEEKRFYIETESFDSLLQSMDTTKFNTFFNRSILSYSIHDHWKVSGGINYSLEKGAGDRIIDRNSSDSLKASFSELAPFLELRYLGIENLKLSTSGRYITHSIYDNKLIASFHAKYDISKKSSVRASYAQGYRSPSLKELYLEFIDVNHNIIGNPELIPETSHDIQLTLEYDPTQFLFTSLNLYNTYIQDRITLLQYEPVKFIYDNVDEYEVRGIQAELTFKKDQITIHSSPSWSFWATNIDRDSIPAFSDVLDWNNSFEYFNPSIDLGITLNHRFVGDQLSYNINSESNIKINTISNYHLVDLSINKSVLENKIQLILGVKNLTDTQYTNISGGVSGSAHSNVGRSAISQGRNFFINVRINI